MYNKKFQKMKRHLFSTIVLSIVMVFTSLIGFSQATDLIISEYIEGSSNNKAIEIFNGTGSPVDLSSYELRRISNGGDWDENAYPLTGTLTDGDVFVIANSSAGSEIAAVADMTSGATFFNGDDAVGLAKDIGGTMTLIDVVGTDGADPGSGWDVAGVTNATANHTLVRKPDVCSPNTDWTTSAGTSVADSEWTVYNIDDFSYIGSHVGNCSGGNFGPSITNISTDPASGNITSLSTVSISANITDDGSVGSAVLNWGTTSGSLINVITMELDEAPTYVSETDIPAQTIGTTVFYEIVAVDDLGEPSSSGELSYSILFPATTTLSYNQSFDTDLGSCYAYSASGATKTWGYAAYGANGYANINAYGSTEVETDWLILPAINFDSYLNERMTFDTWYNYGSDDVDNYLKLYSSADYPGYGDPTTYTWTEINFAVAVGTDEWASSGMLDLSAITGTNVHLALKYNYQPGNYRWWQVDNIDIYEAAFVDVTFQLNMAEQTVSGLGVHVAGSFQGWDPATTEMLDPEMDGTYEVTVSLISGLTYEFKYINGDAWGENGVAQEIVPLECRLSDTENRFVVVPETSLIIDPVCYGSCSDCGFVPPTYDVTFQVDMQNETVGGVVNIAGGFNGWTNTPMTNIGGHIWEYTQSFDEGSLLTYKFKNGDDWEPGGDRVFIVPSENTVLDLVCYGSTEHCPAVDFVLINEVDADQAGTDAQEFIELYDGGIGFTPLHGLVVVLYNGSDDQSYNTAIDLDGQLTDENGYFVIGSETVPNVDLVAFTTNGLQNGADAVALFVGNGTDFPNDTPIPGDLTNLLDALVYDTGDGDDAALLVLLNAGQPQINEQGRGDGEGHSNQRIPNGSGGMRNTETYDQSIPTPGVENIGVFSDWNGINGSVWNDVMNWTNGIPTSTMNAYIPDVSGAKAPFPVISGSASCLNLFMSGSTSLEIGTSGALTVNGTFTNYGTLTIKSDATGTGSLIESDGVSANVERFVSDDTGELGGPAWHYMAIPITSATSDVFEGEYLMYWDEPTETWPFIEDLGVTLNTNMFGYGVWADAATTLMFSGSLNAGAKNIGLTNTAGTTNPTNDPSGFNLVGNPYPSALDWDIDDAVDAWTRTDLGASMYFWTGTQYGVYVKGGGAGSGTNGATNIIPPHQGFMVYCSNVAGGSLAVGNDARVHSSQGFFKSDVASMLKFRINGNNLSDEFTVNVNENASSIFDLDYDAKKFYGIDAAPQAYTMTSQNDKLSINSIPSVKGNQIIPVGVSVGVDGFYEIVLSDIVDFENTPVLLEDIQEHKLIDLKLTSSYKFFMTADDASHRFNIRFTHDDVIFNNDQNLMDGVVVFAKDKKVVVNSIEELTGQVIIFDMMGREVASQKLTNTINSELNVNADQGTYIVKIVSEEKVLNQKVFLK